MGVLDTLGETDVCLHLLGVSRLLRSKERRLSMRTCD